MRWPFIYFAHERLSPAELSAACLDGHLVGVGEGYMPADAVESVPMRAASLGVLCAERLAACLWSAAWVYGGLDEPPPRHTLVRAVGHRVGNLIDRRSVFSDIAVPAEDLLRIGGVLVTTPTRTVADLARRSGSPAGADRHADVSRAMLATGLVGLADVRTWLDAHPRLPGSRAALALVECLEQESPAQEDVTR